MTKIELLELIGNGENSGVEFKRDDIRPEQLAKEIVALVNFQGGRVLVGVEDNGSISGIQRPDLETWIMDTVFGHYVHPMILPFYEEVNIDDEHRVGVISIAQGTSKPYVVSQHGREDIYIRAGSTSRLATREQQARLFALGGMLHAELLPVSGSALADLNLERLRDYLGNIIGDSDLPQDGNAWLTRLCGLGFMTETDDDQALCTIAGLLLFGYKPRRLLRQAGVRWMAFSGTDKTYRALDDTVLDAPLVALRRPRHGTRELINEGLIEQLLERMRPFISEEPDDIDEHMRRERQWHYPLAAVREAIINGLIHRDWTRSSDLEVVAYQDRLEIISPGALQNSMTIEKMIAGQRSPRNSLIVDVMRDYAYVDARGMGVRTKIIPLLREHNGRDPNFIANEDYVAVMMLKLMREQEPSKT